MCFLSTNYDGSNQPMLICGRNCSEALEFVAFKIEFEVCCL
jgi:hypothetical protein